MKKKGKFITLFILSFILNGVFNLGVCTGFASDSTYEVKNAVLNNKSPLLTSDSITEEPLQKALQAALPLPVPYPGNGAGLKAEYFNDYYLSNRIITRIDPTVDFDWKTEAPAHGIRQDRFSIRWTGKVQPLYSETYTFYARADDGVRLWVNNQLIIDKWLDQSETEWSGRIILQAGQKYDIKMEYYENTDLASAKLLWSSMQQQKQIVPQSQLYLPDGPISFTGSGVGLLGKYYDNENFTNRVLSRTDAKIDFDWYTDPPLPPMGPDTYSIRWTGKIQPKYSEQYRLALYCDGRVRLYINGALILNKLTDGEYAAEESNYMYLNAGQMYDIKIEYFKSTGRGTLKFFWSSYTQQREIVSTSQLYFPDKDTSYMENGEGLIGEYYDNWDFTSLKVIYPGQNINFDWGSGSFLNIQAPDTYSVRWTGKIKPRYSETYTFHLVGDDGVRLWVNNRLLINKWVDQSATESTGTITLTAGQKYDIRVEYYENSDQAVAKLHWSSPSQFKEIIPVSCLSYEN
ncbi:MAG: PA14 domain-containing protein [Clostridia bacterium]|nr:PA14 domain-containing protein [Clostridia bacterium]